MTDRLTQLLHAGGDLLEVPAAPTDAIIAAGRRGRTRARAGRAVAGLTAVAVLAGGSAVLLTSSPVEDAPETARDLSAAASFAQQGAFAVGRTIYFGTSGEHRAEIPADVKQLYYTSAGVLVRSGRSPWTDTRGPSDYGLVTPEGDVRSLGVQLGDVAPDTSASEPYLAWSSPGDGATSWTVHVLDVRTSQEATVPVDGAFTWGGWEAPPVSIDGDLVYVGLDDATVAVDYRTGEQQVARGMPASYYPDVVDGRTVLEPPRDRQYRPTGPGQVVEALTGTVVREVPSTQDSFAVLSPDGGYVRISGTVLDVATGASTTLPGRGTDYGWTPDGGLIAVSRDEASICEQGGGSCTRVAQDLGRGVIKVGGNSYES